MNGLCIRDLARITRGELRLGAMPPLGGDLDPVGRIVIDSRQVVPGDVFWGLIGRFHDGSNFAEEAFARGASGVVVAGRHIEPWAGKFSLQVEDANWALWQLARAVRRRFGGRVIAVTGNGSQSVLQQMLHTTLGMHLNGSACWVDPQERTALPFAMLALCEDHDYAVIDMPPGTHGEIQSQSHLCDPQIGVINCHAISQSTYSGLASRFGSDQYELLAGLPRDGWAILNGPTPSLRDAVKNVKANVLWTGCSSDADVVAQHVAYRSGELCFSIDDTQFQVPNAGRHDLPAALACYAVGRVLELSPREIAAGMAQYPGVGGCCEVVRNGVYSIINDLVDAKLAATLAALEYLRDYSAAGKRIVVCGDFEDATADEDRLTKEIGEAVVTRCGADWLFACGEQAEAIIAAARSAGLPHGRAVRCETAAEAASLLHEILERDDVVLVKGKQSSELRTLVRDLTQPSARRIAA